MDLAPSPEITPERSLSPEPPSQTAELATPTTLTPPVDRPDLQVYANAMNAGFDTGVGPDGRFQSPVIASTRLADVAAIDGREAAVEWLPQLGILQDEAAISGVQTALRAGAPGTDDVLNGQLDSRVTGETLLARGQDFDDAVMIVFPGQKINASGVAIPGVGHAGILLIDDATGYATYYEYGRYREPDGSTPRGRVLQREISDAVIDPDTGRPTKASLEQIFSEIAVPNGGGERRDISAAYLDERIDFDQAHAYAEGREAMNANPDRETYDLFLRNCAHFMRETAVQGGAEWLPWLGLSTPVAYMNSVRYYNPSAIPVNYDGDSNRVLSTY